MEKILDYFNNLELLALPNILFEIEKYNARIVIYLCFISY
jgi:hypothetical protein